MPHLFAKLLRPEGALAFLSAAGLRPGRVYFCVAMILEVGFSACLIAGWHVRETALVAALFLFAAGAATTKVSKGAWFWNRGGGEYCVFWALCCLAVAATSA